MVIFPLMYPELFEKFNTQPAKGVLFHGPPGTGKTLLARALANECSLVSGKTFSFFMRKASDCFDKYIGESERKIREVFKLAHSLSPSIIFFDEIDALAPVRKASETNHGPSVVATLLAEMDGISDRGDIIVIGATNRPDAIDPAMRRPGRFDRELYFPPPEAAARLEILKIYTKDWKPQPSEQLLEVIAKATSGYLGSDIKALCSEAVLKAVRRVYPQIYETEYKLLVDAKNVNVTQDDMLSAMSMLSSSATRSTPLAAQPLPEYIKPLLEAQLNDAYEILQAVLPPVSVFKDRKSAVTTPSVFLVSGPCAETLLAPDLLAKMEASTVKELSLTTLVRSHSEAQAVISMFAECRQASGMCVLFIRDVETVWEFLQKHEAAAVMMQLWKTQALGDSTLLLAASSVGHERLPRNLQDLFPEYKQCVYNVREPTTDEVLLFFKPMFSVMPLIPPLVECNNKSPPLPRAPSPGPKMTQEEISRRTDAEARKLRQLRMKLYDIYYDNLTKDSRFKKFIKLVDLKKAQFKNYRDIIKRPMDLYTILSKIDMEQYFCAKEFLDDIDLICANALEYSPDKDISEKKLRLDVCALRDVAHTAVSDEVPTELELECQLIARRRRANGKGGPSPPSCSFYVADNRPFGGTLNFTPDQSNDNHRRRGVRKRNASSSHHRRDRKRRRSSSQKTDRNRRCSSSEDYQSHHEEDRNESRRQNLNLKMLEAEPGPSAPPPPPSPNKERNPAHGEPMEDLPSAAKIDINVQILCHHESRLRIMNLEGKPGPSGSPLPNEQPEPVTPSNGEPMEDKDSNSIRQEILINIEEMEEILNKNVKALSVLGLERLIELYGDLSRTVHAYSRTHNRLKLPQELACIVNRYLQVAKSC